MERYRTRTVEVEAMRLGSPITLEKGVKGRKGDWLIKGPGNHLSVLDDKLFGIRFELVSGAPAEQVAPERRRRGGRRPGPKPGAKKGKPGPRLVVPTVQSRAGGRTRALPSEAKREKCQKLYEGGMELPAIAAQEDVKYATLYGWKTNGGWERN